MKKKVCDPHYKLEWISYMLLFQFFIMVVSFALFSYKRELELLDFFIMFFLLNLCITIFLISSKVREVKEWILKQ